MAIELSNITFTEQNDIVPPSGVEPVLNTSIANTLAGNDIINGIWTITSDFYIGAPPTYLIPGISAFYNTGTLNTADGNDIITGILQNPDLQGYFRAAIYHERGTINTGDGDDIIIGSHNENVDSEDEYVSGYGIYSQEATIIDTGNGNDKITGITKAGFGFSVQSGSIITGNGNDTITGIGTSSGDYIIGIGITNDGNIDSGRGDDIITGTGKLGFENYSTLTTSNGNDTITGIGTSFIGLMNLGRNANEISIINTGNDDDIITGTSTDNYAIGNLSEFSIIDTEDGNDVITAINGFGIYNNGTVNTGNDDDTITSTGVIIYNGAVINSGISNKSRGTIDTSDGNDIITSTGVIDNDGTINTGNDADSIIANEDFPNRALENFNFIGTGEGDDIITSTGVIYNEGVINTGNGEDSIIVDGGVDTPATGYGIYNNGGAINMGDGNDSIIANDGFESGLNSSGTWFLGEGDDYIKGFGSGDFYGGNGNDTLELTPGTYTVGIWGEGGESPIFTKGNQLMITSEFEKLKAGSTIYNFTSLTAGQIIVVA